MGDKPVITQIKAHLVVVEAIFAETSRSRRVRAWCCWLAVVPVPLTALAEVDLAVVHYTLTAVAERTSPTLVMVADVQPLFVWATIRWLLAAVVVVIMRVAGAVAAA